MVTTMQWDGWLTQARRKTNFRPGIELRISDWNASTLTTEPQLPDKSKPSLSLFHNFSRPSHCISTTRSTKNISYIVPMSTIMQIPAPLNKYLRDYQQQGVRFLYSHYVHGKGAVLCDDMGLGKTVQVHVYKPCSNTRIHVRIMYS